ncbi:unnamed protein product [Caenorhabditis angaria]|uniref:ZP domain-containing protein n=1 Tax=Caenorhabditis angaria TaxID=860376 RepID=A0A9P1MXJ1_9PELO|nr:unnamed protein product [Caenorhabditis angaria]
MLILFLLVFLLDFRGAVLGENEAVEIVANEVLGEPSVSCAADAIYVKFRTKSTFLGHVDVKYTPDKSCFQSLVTNNQIEVLIPHEECMVPRKRSLIPIGVLLEVTISVSFNPEFTTADDRVFNLQCFHKQNSTKSEKMKISEIGSPTTPSPPPNSPKCDYFVFLDENRKIPAGRLSLGDQVWHFWQCSNIPINNCIIVENCELVGGEQKYQVIDENGCSKYQHIMPQLNYQNETSIASAKVKVFGVSHTPIVYFSCQIRLESKNSETGICQKPDCPSSTNQRHKRETSIPNFIDVRSQNLEISQLAVTESEKLALTNNENLAENKEEEKVAEIQADCPQESSSVEKSSRICAEFQDVLIVSMFLTIGCIITTSVVVVLIIRRQKYEIASMT